MPVTPTYPGVYVQEIPSGVRPITGVATSIAAFVDFFRRGPMNRAVQILSLGDFDREFGGLDARSEGSYAIQQFFLNGGTQAWVVRVASGNAAAATVEMDSTIPAAAPAALTATTISQGVWGNNLRIRVDANVPVAGEFNLVVSEVAVAGDRSTVLRQEIFRNLSMTAAQANFVETLVNDPNTGSKLVRVTANGATAPLANATLSGAHGANPTVPASPAVSVTIGTGIGDVTRTAALAFPPGTPALPAALALTAIAPVLEAAIRAAAPENPAFAGASVDVVGTRLRVLAGPTAAAARVTFANAGPNTTASDLLLTGAAIANCQEYALGGGAVANTAQLAGAAGNDGTVPNGAALIGDLGGKTGLHALEVVDLFNLLCLPRTAIVGGADGLTATEAQAVLAVAEAYCERRRAFLLTDAPAGFDEPQEIRNWLAANATLRHRNAGLY
jgi:phage tail sheath protein FI